MIVMRFPSMLADDFRSSLPGHYVEISRNKSS